MQNKTRVLAVLSAGFIITASVLLAGSLFSPGGGKTLTDERRPDVETENPFDESRLDNFESAASDVPETETETEESFVLTVREAEEENRSTPLLSDRPLRTTEPQAPVARPGVAPSRTEGTAVSVDVPKVPVVSVLRSKLVNQQAFWVQIASFTSEIKAKEERDRLHRVGYSVNIETVRINERPVFRLRIGAWNSREEALKFRDQIRLDNNAEYKEAFITESKMLRLVYN